MSIPALEPPVDPGAPAGRPPGSAASRLVGAIDDSAGSGVVIPLNVVDQLYVDWRMADLEGWDSAELEEGAESRAGDDGAWDAQNHYGARTLSIKGKLVAPTYEAREAAEYRLRQAVPPRRMITFRLEETTPKYVTARRTGRLMIRALTDVISEFDVALLAPDPRKYGLNVVQGGLSIAQPAAGLAPPWTPPILLPQRAGGSDTITLTNTGTYETQPIIRIDGPGRDITITNTSTGLALGYDVILGAGEYLLIDCHAGVALLNGTAPRGPVPGSAVTSRFVIAAGPNLLHLSGTATDPTFVATATVQFNPAWD